MKHLFGIESYPYQKLNQTIPIIINTDQLINSHILLCGMSGSGKSHQLRRLVESAIRQGVDVDIFDVHDDLDVRGATSVLYSESTKYGCNPLALNPDPHSGGVRKQINQIIDLLNNTSRKLGPKQVSCLRYLISDIYFLNGILENNPDTWVKRHITEEDRAFLIEKKDFNALKNYYPTINDLIEFGKRKLKSLFIGGDNKTVTALEKVNREAAKLNG